MSFDVDLHRITLRLANRLANGKPLALSAIDAGPRDAAQTMVFIHGFGGRAAYWEYQLEHFQSDYRVVALDLRGHGYSDAPTAQDGARYDVPELVADIEAALEALQVPQRFVLVCHSFGGALSSYFLKHHPERVSALVIIASAARFRLRWAGRLLLRVPPTLLSWIRQLLPYVGYDVARLYPPAHVVYLQNKNALSVWDGRDYLRGIGTPAIVILGQRDILFAQDSYTEVAQLVPNAEQVVIAVSAHQVMVERPDAVNRAIERFLQAQADPVALAEAKAARRAQRRTERLALEAERPWLKSYDVRTPYRIKMPTVSLPRLLEASARRFAKTPAIHYGGRTIGWGELDRLAARFAHGLIAAGIRPGEKVVLALPNMPQWLIAYFGILKAGAVAVLLDPAIEMDVLLARVAETEAVMLLVLTERKPSLQAEFFPDPRAHAVRRVILADPADYKGWRESLKSALQHLPQWRSWMAWVRSRGLGKDYRRHEGRFMQFRRLLTRPRHDSLNRSQSMDEIAIIAYTFGTGGRALPVPLSHRNLAANALQLRHWLPESRPGDERFLAQQPLWTTYGLTGLLHLGVYLGATLILLPGAEVGQLLKTVKKMRPTFFPTTPRMVRQLTQTAGVRRYGLASIRVCAVSGSALAQESREAFEKITRGRLIDAYGLTEASPAILAMPVVARRRGGMAGLPLPDTEARILDFDSGLPCAFDTPGQLWVRGPQVFAGYGGWDAEANVLGAARLRDGWLATGDVASMDEEGFFTIVDRMANMLVRHGQRVFPRQVEDILFEHPAVALAEVRRIIDEQGIARLQATVLLHRNMQVAEEELLSYCQKRLHPAAVPDSIGFEKQ